MRSDTCLPKEIEYFQKSNDVVNLLKKVTYSHRKILRVREAKIMQGLSVSSWCEWNILIFNGDPHRLSNKRKSMIDGRNMKVYMTPLIHRHSIIVQRLFDLLNFRWRMSLVVVFKTIISIGKLINLLNSFLEITNWQCW